MSGCREPWSSTRPRTSRLSLSVLRGSKGAAATDIVLRGTVVAALLLGDAPMQHVHSLDHVQIDGFAIAPHDQHSVRDDVSQLVRKFTGQLRA